MLHVLTIDLAKAGKKGAQHKVHKYLWRVMKPDGKWRYFPDAAYGEKLENFGHFVDGKWEWKEGLSTTNVINTLMLGGPVTISNTSDVLKVNPKTGKPLVKDGLLRHYEVIDRKIYDNAKELRAKQGYVPSLTDERLTGVVNKFTTNADGTPKEVLQRTKVKVGEREWYVFAYAKSPVHKRDDAGAPTRWAGFVKIDDMHPSIADTVNLSKLRRDILDHQIGTHDAVERPELPTHAHEQPLVHPGPSPDKDEGEDKKTYNKRVKEHSAEEREYDADRAKRDAAELAAKHAAGQVIPGDQTVRMKPAPPSEETLRALGIVVSEKADLADVKRALLKRVHDAKKTKTQIKNEVARRREKREPVDESTVVGKRVEIPDWIHAKFRDDEEMMRMIDRKPATFLVTIGAVVPTRNSKAFNERLAEEWIPEIYRLCRHDADALKFTRNYEAMRRADEDAGITTAHPDSKVRKYMTRVTSDMAQHLNETLLELMPRYQATQSPRDRFDRLAYTTLANRAASLAKQWSKLHGQTEPYVNESEKGLEAHKLRQNAPLNPREMAELSMLSAHARQSLADAFDAMHPTHRAVFLAQQYLDDPSQERSEISERNALLDDVIARHDEAGTEMKRVTHSRKLRTFKDIAARLPVLTDPKTGQAVKIGELHRINRDARLNRWTKEAVDHLRRHFSTTTQDAETSLPEAERKHGFVHVDAKDEDHTPSERLTAALLGRNKEVKRVLTNEGRNVMRYLELERKLADSARSARRGEIAQEVDRAQVPKPQGQRTTSYVLRTKGAKTPITVPVTPKIGPLKHVVVIPGHGDTSTRRHSAEPSINFFTAHENADLSTRLGLRAPADRGGQSYLHAQDSTGLSVMPNVRVGTHTQRYLDLAKEHYGRLEGYRKLSAVDLAQEHARLTEGVKRLSKLVAARGPAEQLHTAAIALYEARTKMANMHAKLSERRGQLSTATLTRDEIKAKLKPHTPTAADEAKLASAEAKFDAAVNAVHTLLPAKMGAAFTSIYTTAIKENEPITSSHRAELDQFRQMRVQAAQARLALVDHDMKRRAALKAAHKALIPADNLIKAFEDFDFALARYYAEAA